MAPLEETRKMMKPWDTADLILAEACNYGSVKPSNLQETASYPLHSFFAPELWQAVSHEDYKLLLPSMHLASNLLQVGLPYLCSFVPADRVHRTFIPKKSPKGKKSDDFQVNLWEWDADQLQETREDLDVIAGFIDWELNDTIATENKWLGVTRLVTDEKWGPRPWKDLLRADIIRSDMNLKVNGHKRRRLRIGIMTEYVDALKTYSRTSEEHLRATFLAAITMTHEIGHIVWHQDFRSMSYDINGKEPYVDDYSISELGCCFIANIFDGKNPFECGKQIPTDFTRALYWERVPKMSTNELYRTDHSLSIPYMQRILSQESWNQLNPRRPDFSVDARAMLEPEEDVVTIPVPLDGSVRGPYRDGVPATANTREWTITEFNDVPKVIWKTAFADRRIRSEEKLKDLTKAEKEYAMYEISLANPGAFKNVLEVSASQSAFVHDYPDEDEVRPIDDGVVPLDLVASDSTINLKAFKRIQIEYRAKPGDFKNKSDFHSHPKEYHQVHAAEGYGANIALDDWFETLDSGATRYDSTVPRDFQFGGPNVQYEPADILALLANKQPAIIAKTTIKDVHKFCTERKITFGRAFPTTHIEQNQKLDLTSEADRTIIERIRQHCLKKAEQLFEGNNQAILYIYFAELKYIDDWAREDLVRKCKAFGLNTRGHIETLQRRVGDRMAKLLHLFAKGFGLKAEEEDFDRVGLVDHVDLIQWTDEEFLTFFRINNLPAWGNRRIWVERHAAFEREQIQGLATRRDIDYDSKGEIQRSIDLVEIYAWDAVLKGSSVQALKGALLEAGHFPSDATLELYFGNERQTALQDDKPLAYYEPASWENLSLVLTRTSPPDTAMKDAEPPVLVYKPRLPAGLIIDPSPTSSSTPFGNAGLGRLLGSTDDVSSSPPAQPVSIPQDVQRIYNLTHNLARPTVTEALNAIHTRFSELTAILKPSGARDTLRPHLASMHATSAVEMLDSYEDMLEVREDRQRHVDLQVDPTTVLEEDCRKRVEELRELRPDLVVGDDGMVGDRPVELKRARVGGYMGDLYGALRRREGLD